MKTILFIHQSAELYGSDKTLFSLVKEIQLHDIKPIVVLPEEGDLAILLRESNIEIIISPIIKLSRSIFSPINFVKLPFLILSSLNSLEKQLRNHSIDLVHSNTLAVLIGALYAKWKKIGHVWHVHEIIEKPYFLNKFYRVLVNSLSTKVVFNSKASFYSLVGKNSSLKAKSSVIYNGVDKPNKIYTLDEINNFKLNEMKLSSETIVVGIVGRISRWKGHLLLLEAFEKLRLQNSNVFLLVIGSPPLDQTHFLSNLEKEIFSKKLNEFVKIIPFSKDIWKYWAIIDIAVVPSTEPEPFGLVAVEALLSKKPVIVAGHGGLLEIIEHQKTGLLFEPNNVDSLMRAIQLLISDQALSAELGINGQKSVLQKFTTQKYVNNFVELYQNIS